MAYTVKQLALMSGVTVRTPHFFDEMELLKPAYTRANGYRIYEEPQLLMLQQILFPPRAGVRTEAHQGNSEPATIRKNRRSQVAPAGSRKERRADPHAD
jgi:hypothetical protein